MPVHHARRLLAFLLLLTMPVLVWNMPETEAQGTLEPAGTSWPAQAPVDDDEDIDEILDSAVPEKTGRKRSKNSIPVSFSAGRSGRRPEPELTRASGWRVPEASCGAPHSNAGTDNSLASLCTFRN